ncbi:Uncharacterised protein g851 [Pycnogonum litorale]
MHVDFIKLLIMVLLLTSYINSRNFDRLSRRHRKNNFDRESVRHRKKNRPKGSRPAECCPSKTQITEPRGGISKSGIILELYRDRNSTQRFYETVCKPHILDRPCRFLNHHARRKSSCVQLYGYTYALVRDLDDDQSTSSKRKESPSSWRMDYITIKNGCSCLVNKDMT